VASGARVLFAVLVPNDDGLSQDLFDALWEVADCNVCVDVCVCVCVCVCACASKG
jgi:hypothetical protein